jgi:hypothetical protein
METLSLYNGTMQYGRKEPAGVEISTDDAGL